MAEAIVEHDYAAKQPDELSIKAGDVIKDVVKKQEGWCEGVLDGKRGLFPDNFVMLMQVKMRQNATTSVRRCRVIYSYKQEHDDELSLHLGDVIEVVGEEEEGWWRGRINGKVGVFPSNFVEEIKEIKGDKEDKAEKGVKLEEEEKKKKKMLNNVENGSVIKDEEESAEHVKVTKSRIICEVKYAYQAQNSDELSLKEGDVVTLLSKDGQDAGWWRGELDGKIGVFPDNFVVLAEKHDNHNQPLLQDQKQKHKQQPPHKDKEKTPPAVPGKKPSLPSKKSPLAGVTGGAAAAAAGGILSSITDKINRKIADTIDGTSSSKTLKVCHDLDVVNCAESGATEAYHAFDNIERYPVLQDPRATRVKGPGRSGRPPSVALKEEGDSVVLNGNSDYGSLENEEAAAAASAEIKPKSIDLQKPPWLDEMKKMNKRSMPTPAAAPTTTTGAVPVDKEQQEPVDVMSKSMPNLPKPIRAAGDKPKTPLDKPPMPSMEPTASVNPEKVIMRAKPPVLRPQSIDVRTSPPASLSKPPVAEDRSSIGGSDQLSGRHFNELSERIAVLEAEMARQRDEFTGMMEELRGRLQVETDMRMLLQVELEKLQCK